VHPLLRTNISSKIFPDLPTFSPPQQNKGWQN